LFFLAALSFFTFGNLKKPFTFAAQYSNKFSHLNIGGPNIARIYLTYRPFNSLLNQAGENHFILGWKQEAGS
jgi:hypothetical protein